MRSIFRPISAKDVATSCLVMSDPPPKTSEVLTGSCTQIKIPNGNMWAKKLGKIKYSPKLAINSAVKITAQLRVQWVSGGQNSASQKTPNNTLG